MKNNLLKECEADLESLSNMFVNNGFETVEEYIFEHKKTKFTITLSPKLLRYGYVYRPGVSRNKKKVDDTLTIWIGVRIFVSKHEDIFEKAITVRDILQKMPLAMFYDEDAIAGYFTKELSHSALDGYNLTCYFNPDYPDGYWENHTL